MLSGNLALDGCIVKTAGVDESILKFEGPARIFESQDAAVEGILGNKIKPGDVVVVRYEGPRGGPGMVTVFFELNGQPRRVRVPDRAHGASAAKARRKAEPGNEAHGSSNRRSSRRSCRPRPAPP